MEIELQPFIEGCDRLGLSLDRSQQELFRRYVQILATESRRFAAQGPGRAATMWLRHCLDALTIVRALPDAAEKSLERTCVDVGTGIGFPGLSLAIAFPHWHVTLIERSPSRVTFLTNATHHLRLAHVTVIGGHAQSVRERDPKGSTYDLCVVRAVASIARLLPLVTPFVRHEGDIVLYKGLKSVQDELREAENVAQTLGVSPPDIIDVSGVGSIGGCLVHWRGTKGRTRG